MTNLLEVVRAGAGSGKTTDLCNTVAQAVADGLDPARILATTFTKKAAAELKGRVQAKLLEGDWHTHADRLELAAIGTVHSVAHQLLRRYAIELGLSPRLEVFEQGADKVLSDLLAAIPLARWEPLTERTERLGVSDLSSQILALLAAKRGNRICDNTFREHLAASASRVCEILSPNGVASTAQPVSHLFALAEAAINNIETTTTDTTKTTSDAIKKLRKLNSSKGPLWGTYLDAAKISAGKRSGADQLLDELRLHAAEVRNNPQLHEDLIQFNSLLTEEILLLDAEYTRYKAERGLVDFTDLETLLLGLLEDESLADRLSQDYDLVLVDEFQDTNPLQLAIFQRLRTIAPRNRWVGDSRQAIYGFRDTDPRLVAEVWEQVPEEQRSTLPNNHRSQKGLVQLVGELFAPHFDEDPRQIPQNDAEDRGVERWLLNVKNNDDEAVALACGIAQLHREGTRFGDIAILERGNAQLTRLGVALDEVGIPYLLESPGLFSTREGQLLLAGLRLVANRNDSLAAATVMHLSSDPTTPTPDWLSERLHALANAPVNPETGEAEFQLPWKNDPILAGLEAIDYRNLSPSLVIQQVVEALAIPRRVHTWGNAPQRCSNLDSAIRHAREYEESAATGSGSATLSGLILHLEELATSAKDSRFTSQGHDAVTLMTYHGAKGLKWPVVVLSGLNSARDPDMWKPVVSSETIADDPLANRQLRAWFWPFGITDGPFGSIKKGSLLEIDALATPEGQDQSQCEAQENLRLLYVGCTRAKQKLVFSHRAGNYKWLESLTRIDDLLDPTQEPGEHPIEGIATTLVIRHLSHEELDQHCFDEPATQVWISQDQPSELPVFNKRYYSPSQAQTPTGCAEFTTVTFPGSQFFPAKTTEDQYSSIGDAVHGYMAALPSLINASPEQKTKVAERCITVFSVAAILPASELVRSGDRFIDWVNETYPGAKWHSEVPVSAPRSDGGQWVGTIDLILELSDGMLILIDHKSAPIRRDHCATKAAEYAGQLLAYNEILASSNRTVDATLIHFPLAGVVAQLRDS
ncbi:UvrD-helicase domain-containing protein [Roseiconus lacunae]|uniref:UvrD-helicase domain-containing protein n=1 Tax=Roseiconus lacunae TaxID=2605694 RepID=UPI0011F34D2C|nr:UvrD-helicase domain-containing protein [Roseiconus lacunae]